MSTTAEQSAQAIVAPSRAWLRALELTAPIPRNRARTFATVIEEVASRMGDAAALLSDRQTLSYSQLAARVNQYARWAVAQGLTKGDVVCLLMPNRPEYFAIWLGITSVGVVVSLLNTNLVGPSLAHSMRIVSPRHIIASADLAAALDTAMTHLDQSPAIWISGDARGPYASIDRSIQSLSGEALSETERRSVTIDDLALYIYTSGTTGLPKAARVSHARVMQWSHWFAGMMDVQSTDRLYNCLPMYHSVGGVQAIGAMLASGGSAVVREKFSARQFFADVARYDCTLIQYIGELCRYLLHTEPSSADTGHRVRLACGNGMAAEVWNRFKDRFQIPQILEFYAATEGSVSLFNMQGKSGAIGHIPGYLSHRFAPALVSIDVETGQPLRDTQGLCIAAAVNQPGEALGKISQDPAQAGTRFEGYTSSEASDKKILRHVLEHNDAWFRTGDLMRRDEKGYYYFVDRIGDTFRRKGENVATTEVAEALCAYPGIEHANVYGVAVPGVEGRVGMAALVAHANLDLSDLRDHLASLLPGYARPVFLRIRTHADLTGTFKYSKSSLIREGYDPHRCPDALYCDTGVGFVPLDEELFAKMQAGDIRL
jgi:fatty-acyl-CoA synthase